MVLHVEMGQEVIRNLVWFSTGKCCTYRTNLNKNDQVHNSMSKVCNLQLQQKYPYGKQLRARKVLTQ